MKKTLLMLLMLTLFAACNKTDNTPKVLSQSAMSRAFDYLVFKKPGQQYEEATAIGGEAMNIQKIWAFKDQTYQVTLTSDTSDLGVYIDGEGLEIKEKVKNRQFTVKVLEEDAMIEISQTSHPQPSEYKILVKRLN